MLSELAKLMADLYTLTQNYMIDESRSSHDGHAFEDAVIEIIREHKEEHNLEVFDPRMTLPFKTYSSLRHQLDGVFKHGSRYYFIECKHRKTVTAECIEYFNSKLLDFALGAHIAGLKEEEVKGLFLASSPIGDNQLMYGLAYRIIVIDPETPSLNHMIATSENNDLKEALLGLKEKIDPAFDYLDPPPVDTDKLLKSYRYLTVKWRKEQGG